MKAYVFAFCGLLLASPALAQPSGSTGASESATAPAASVNPGDDHARAEPRQICRRIDSGVSRRIGSRLVCHTAAEWRELQDAS